MIIECINCNKKFEVNSDLIPDEGRNIQCGSCNHIWFFKKDYQKLLKKDEVKFTTDQSLNEEKISIKKKDVKSSKKKEINYTRKNTVIEKSDNKALIKYQKKSSLNLNIFLSYIIVLIISFIGVIIVMDTFKSPLYNYFPNLEFILFNFYETIEDIKLFIIDLI